MKTNKEKQDIYAKYRQVLNMPQLTKAEIDVMRSHILLLAQTLCEHVWEKKFY